MSRASLFKPVCLGALNLPNRIVMAPLTRARADVNSVPTPMMADYYAQRADCGLIVTEATAVERRGMGWYRAPGIWNDDMVRGWRGVTDAVHHNKGRIVSQLWHMGRLVLPEYLGGDLPIGPSAIAGEGQTFAPRPDGDESLFLPMKPYVTPREMNPADIEQVVAAYRAAAANAVRAGFDGVEIHGANGYIIDQFLQSKTNRRTDDYGGSLENRVRLLAEIAEAVTAVVEPGTVGLRISPTSERKGMGDEDPGALAQAIGEICSHFDLAYVHLIEPIASGFMEKTQNPVMDRLRGSYHGAVIQNGSFDGDTAAAYIEGRQADAISFGRPFIANPDLVRRLADDLPLSEANFDYAYVGDRKGYTDYPTAG